MIEALAPDRSDQPFGKAILPRRGWCSGLVPDAHGTQSARDDNAMAPPAVKPALQQVHQRVRRTADRSQFDAA